MTNGWNQAPGGWSSPPPPPPAGQYAEGPIAAAGSWPAQGSWAPGGGGPLGGYPGGDGRGPGRRAPLLIGLAGGLVLAIVVGAVLGLTGVLRFGTGGSADGPDTRPLTLPDELLGMSDGLMVLAANPSVLGGDVPDDVVARARDELEMARSGYQQAYGGAATAVRSYASLTDQSSVVAIAVRSDSPGLTGGFTLDLRQLDHDPYQRVETVGEVQCYVVNVSAASDDGDSSPDDDVTSFCRRGSDVLTIQVQGNGFTGPEGQQRMAEITDAAFGAVAD